jgi:mono/diheme cytochrome c family protein
MLKPFLLFAAVVLLIFTSTPAPAQAGKSAPDMHAKAKKLYDLDCALCHGATGDGKTDLGKDMQLNMLDWTDPKALAGMSDQALFDAIRKGKGKMPGEDASRAKDDEVKALVQYIRHLAKDQSAPAPQPAAQPSAPPAPAPGPTAAPAPSR